MDIKEEVKIIRTCLKKICKTLSIKNGTGTACGWVKIRGSGELGRFTEEEGKSLEKIGLSAGGNLAVISPEDRKFWIRHLHKI